MRNSSLAERSTDPAIWFCVRPELSGRTPRQLEAEFGSPARVIDWIKARTTWWLEQGFAPVDWVYQSHAYDAHDVGTTPGFGGDIQAGSRNVETPGSRVAVE